jgi:acyl carrier protein
MSNSANNTKTYIARILNGEVANIDQAKVQAEVNELDSFYFNSLIDQLQNLFEKSIAEIAAQSRFNNDAWTSFYKALAIRALQH